MKYCNNCGNKLQEGQRFCDKCGRDVNGANNNVKLQPPRKNNGNKMAIIIITVLVFLILIAGLLFGAYKLFWDNDNSKLNIFNNSHQNGNSKSNSSSTGVSPSIDILTKRFNSSFLNEDNRNGYEGVNIGMSKDEIINKFGSSDGEITIAGATVEKYGNIAVHYDNGVVDRYFVVPSNDISIQQYTSYHGEETMKADEGGLIYDDNPNNAFTIKVYVNEYGNVTGIESVNQIERNDSSHSGDNLTDGNITSDSEAEKIGKDYLSEKYDDYWFHSVDEYKGVYRVNYGKGNASHAHDAIYIDQKTGNITENDPNGED
ncbi:zinc-ribbon domain-containing protein [Staphylococcus xylosus]|uniref:zinc-ribbon domain-containing protein n=2 Tax=Staphylococcus xylosus TaxID=1288 RepID=UPI001304C5DB|nr:zinc ribbon domain-containing protein [Staphylococcus xylosus]MEB7755823.1 zinc-ribbon domain-containing protein [Staphylococcus xylosus]MEB7797611.1 zinc-ribbon domain-containing protein [Staphylococcus xylosus]MEB8146880.1 zinc-ribbon domain-containing protein [Staphylococcus xylosus]MEB8306155.1 zinc-ribbon domain-containing protein [Staphylococcus xylosus]